MFDCIIIAEIAKKHKTWSTLIVNFLQILTNSAILFIYWFTVTISNKLFLSKLFLFVYLLFAPIIINLYLLDSYWNTISLILKSALINWYLYQFFLYLILQYCNITCLFRFSNFIFLFQIYFTVQSVNFLIKFSLSKILILHLQVRLLNLVFLTRIYHM